MDVRGPRRVVTGEAVKDWTVVCLSYCRHQNHMLQPAKDKCRNMSIAEV